MTWMENPLSAAGQSSQMCVPSPVGCAQGRDLVVFRSTARGRWWMWSLSCPSPQRKSQCMRWNAPTQPVRSRRKASSSRRASRSTPSRLSFKVGSTVHPEELPTDPARGGSPIIHLLPSSLPRSTACQPQLHPAAGWPSDEEPRSVPRRKPRAQRKHTGHPR